MPFIQYVPRKFSAKSLDLIDKANTIIAEYQEQGFDLTLRQLYYQFVSRDFIPNTQKDYKLLGSVINDARLAGLIDWETIVDRTRNLQSLSHWSSPAEIVEACVQSYRVDMWETQQNRVEVWIEKDALVGVIERVCQRNDVAYFSCRGYTSQSEMWSAAQRLIEYENNGQAPIIIHLGDHDPSGKDMTRDIEDRMRLFGANVEVDRIALNMDQIRKYQPPPNPCKITDSRASGYIKEFGTKSWELDALEPQVLEALIQKTIDQYIDQDEWNERVVTMKSHREHLAKAAKKLEKV